MVRGKKNNLTTLGIFVVPRHTNLLGAELRVHRICII